MTCGPSATSSSCSPTAACTMISSRMGRWTTWVPCSPRGAAVARGHTGAPRTRSTRSQVAQRRRPRGRGPRQACDRGASSSRGWRHGCRYVSLDCARRVWFKRAQCNQCQTHCMCCCCNHVWHTCESRFMPACLLLQLWLTICSASLSLVSMSQMHSEYKADKQQ